MRDTGFSRVDGGQRDLRDLGCHIIFFMLKCRSNFETKIVKY